MELTVGKADLQKELQLCQGVVEKRSTIPILSNVLLKAADGRLQIAATDLDVTILSSCAARVTTPGGVTIEAKRLANHEAFWVAAELGSRETADDDFTALGPRTV